MTLVIDSISPRAQSLISLANEATEVADSESFVGMANDFSVTDDGWAMIKYGDYPNARGMQRFNRESAEAMVGYFKNTWARIKRAFTGLPVYRGHPDQADQVRSERKRAAKAGNTVLVKQLDSLINEIERRYPDKTVYGTINDVEARPEGLAMKVTLTSPGASLVNEAGLTCFSPHWLAQQLPAEGGVDLKQPVLLLSIGLTARPNIPDTSLVNEPSDLPAMNKLLAIQLLAALGQSLANEATDEQVNTALTAALPQAKALTARPESTALANEQSARTAAETKVTELSTALANERTAHASALVNAAITAGRITEAQKPVWLTRLTSNFAGESVALANEQGALKVKSQTGKLGQQKPASSASETFTALVNERMDKFNEAHATAWAAVKGSPEGKALFDVMTTPSAEG